MFPFVLFVVSLLLCFGVAVEVLRGFRRLTRLEHVAPATGDVPRVSIIFGARDEQEAIEEAVRSHVAQDYQDSEVIAVDDRSSDRTPQILAQLSYETARLHVISVEELPAGWLGKCNALRRGAEAASGDWLLFTDADVVMEPFVLRRALALALHAGLDHLYSTSTRPDYTRSQGGLRVSFLSAASSSCGSCGVPPSSRSYGVGSNGGEDSIQSGSCAAAWCDTHVAMHACRSPTHRQS
jgi:glycosyltransferase involved in cell wall biosynthesis